MQIVFICYKAIYRIDGEFQEIKTLPNSDKIAGFAIGFRIILEEHFNSWLLSIWIPLYVMPKIQEQNPIYSI